MGERVAAELEAMGLQVQWQQVEDGRPNVVGSWEGTGGGKSLMFNGHMDTSYSGREPWLRSSGASSRKVRPGRAHLRARHLEHEGRARVLPRSCAVDAGRRRSACGGRDDRVRRAARSRRPSGVPTRQGANTAAMRPALATCLRTAASPTCAFSASRPSRRSCSATTARSGCASRRAGRSSTPPSARAGATENVDRAHARGARRRARV